MPIKVERRGGQSWGTWIVQSAASLLNPETLCTGAERLAGIKPVEGSAELTPPELDECSIEARVVNGLHIYTITFNHQILSNVPKKHVYYFPGGAFKARAAPLHWVFCAAMVGRIPNCTVTLISYPLAPQNTAPSVYKTIQQTCQALLIESRDRSEIAMFAGDSAGGNLALSIPLASLAEDPTCLAPKAVLIISPILDLSMSNPQSAQVERNDPALTTAFCRDAGAGWAGEWSLDDPRLSPIKADFSPFVQRDIRLYGAIGTYDVLYPDVELLVKKVGADLKGSFLFWEKQMHDFPLMFRLGMPEAVGACEWILDVLRSV